MTRPFLEIVLEIVDDELFHVAQLATHLRSEVALDAAPQQFPER